MALHTLLLAALVASTLGAGESSREILAESEFEDDGSVVDCDGQEWTVDSCRFRQYNDCKEWLQDYICDYGQRFTKTYGVRGSPNFNCPKFYFDNGDCLCGAHNEEWMFVTDDGKSMLEDGGAAYSARYQDPATSGFRADEEDWDDAQAALLYNTFYAEKSGDGDTVEKTMTCDGYCLSDWACKYEDSVWSSVEGDHDMGKGHCKSWLDNGKCDYGESYSAQSITMNFDCHVWWYPHLKLDYNHDNGLCSEWSFKECDDGDCKDHPGYYKDPELRGKKDGVCENDSKCQTRKLDKDVYNAVLDQIENCPIAEGHTPNKSNCHCKNENCGDDDRKTCENQKSRGLCYGECTRDQKQKMHNCEYHKGLCKWEDPRTTRNEYCVPTHPDDDVEFGNFCYQKETSEECEDSGGNTQLCRWHVATTDWMNLVFTIVDDPKLVNHLDYDLRQIDQSFKSFEDEKGWSNQKFISGAGAGLPRNHDSYVKWGMRLNFGGNKLTASSAVDMYQDWQTLWEQPNPSITGHWQVTRSGGKWRWENQPTAEEKTVHENLRRFLYDYLEANADNYFLGLWGHGSGWYMGQGEKTRVTVTQLARSMDEALASTNKDLQAFQNKGSEECNPWDTGRSTKCFKFNIIAFDACRMATLSTLSALKNRARYILASEEMEPISGWEWKDLLPFDYKTNEDREASDEDRFRTYKTSENDEDETASYAEHIMDNYINKVVSHDGLRSWMTLTLFDMNHYHGFETKFFAVLTDLSSAVTASDHETINMLTRINQDDDIRMGARSETEDDGDLDPYAALKKGAIQFADVRSFLEQLNSEYNVSGGGFNQCRATKDLITEAINELRKLVKTHKNGDPTARYKGLGFYWPYRPTIWNKQHKKRKLRFDHVRFVDTEWGELNEYGYEKNAPRAVYGDDTSPSYTWLFTHSFSCASFCLREDEHTNSISGWFQDVKGLGSIDDTEARTVLEDFYDYCSQGNGQGDYFIGQKDCAKKMETDYWWCQHKGADHIVPGRDCGTFDEETQMWSYAECNRFTLRMPDQLESTPGYINEKTRRAGIYVDSSVTQAMVTLGIIRSDTYDGDSAIDIVETVHHIYERPKPFDDVNGHPASNPNGHLDIDDPKATQFNANVDEEIQKTMGLIEFSIDYPTINASMEVPHVSYMNNPTDDKGNELAYEVLLAVTDKKFDDRTYKTGEDWRKGYLEYNEIGGYPDLVSNDRPVFNTEVNGEPRTSTSFTIRRCRSSVKQFVDDEWSCEAEDLEKMDDGTWNVSADIMASMSDLTLVRRQGTHTFAWVHIATSFGDVESYCLRISECNGELEVYSCEDAGLTSDCPSDGAPEPVAEPSQKPEPAGDDPCKSFDKSVCKLKAPACAYDKSSGCSLAMENDGCNYLDFSSLTMANNAKFCKNKGKAVGGMGCTFNAKSNTCQRNTHGCHLRPGKKSCAKGGALKNDPNKGEYCKLEKGRCEPYGPFVCEEIVAKKNYKKACKAFKGACIYDKKYNKNQCLTPDNPAYLEWKKNGGGGKKSKKDKSKPADDGTGTTDGEPAASKCAKYSGSAGKCVKNGCAWDGTTCKDV